MRTLTGSRFGSELRLTERLRVDARDAVLHTVSRAGEEEDAVDSGYGSHNHWRRFEPAPEQQNFGIKDRRRLNSSPRCSFPPRATEYPAEMFEKVYWCRSPTGRPIRSTRCRAQDDQLLGADARAADRRRENAAEGSDFPGDQTTCRGLREQCALVRDGAVISPICRTEEVRRRCGISPVPPGPRFSRARSCRESREGGRSTGLKEKEEPSERRALTIHDILAADELPLTNSSWGRARLWRWNRTWSGPAGRVKWAGLTAAWRATDLKQGRRYIGAMCATYTTTMWTSSPRAQIPSTICTVMPAPASRMPPAPAEPPRRSSASAGPCRPRR